MICRLSQAEPLKVMSFTAFARMCKARFDERQQHALQHFPKAEFGCYRCETGQAISCGELTELPTNVTLINLNEETTMKKIALPPGLDAKALKSCDLVNLKVTDLRPYWIGGVLPAKKEGVCPNCKRRMQICAASLCGACYHAAAGQVGVKLFEALIAIAARVGGGPAVGVAAGPGGMDAGGATDTSQGEGQVVPEVAREMEPGRVMPLELPPDIETFLCRLKELEAFWEQLTDCLQPSLSPRPPSTAAVVNAVITLQKRLARRDVEVSVALEILEQDTTGARFIGVEPLEDACRRVMAAKKAPGQDLDPATMAGSIRLECQRLADFLVAKNHSYGDSAANPVRIFSRADSEEQLKVRIDDKISRIRNGQGYPGDNDVQDLLGYLLLLGAVRGHKQAVTAKEKAEATEAMAA